MFSIIVPHYQGVVAHAQFLDSMDSLLTQDFTDYEILCYHDGPLLEDVPLPVDIQVPPKFIGDWGHTNRNAGIHHATHDYILHFNADNILYPGTLKRMADFIECEGDIDGFTFPIIMTDRGVLKYMHGLTEHLDKYAGRIAIQESVFKNGPIKINRNIVKVLAGDNVVVNAIDALQLVMKRTLWLEHGGWTDKRLASDGYQYEIFDKKHDLKYLAGPPLGEHR